MLKVVLYQCPKCGLGENGNEFMHKREYLKQESRYSHPSIVKPGTQIKALLTTEEATIICRGHRKIEEFRVEEPIPERIKFVCRGCNYQWEVPCE
jgi:hypothetical protein